MSTDRCQPACHTIKPPKVKAPSGAVGGPSRDIIEAIVRRVAPLGWHLQVYVEGEQLPELAPMFARLPVPVVVDHIGQIRGVAQCSTGSQPSRVHDLFHACQVTPPAAPRGWPAPGETGDMASRAQSRRRFGFGARWWQSRK
jgi:predicted TIM-barrel fold metal-dependent hydrolase